MNIGGWRVYQVKNNQKVSPHFLDFFICYSFSAFCCSFLASFFSTYSHTYIFSRGVRTLFFHSFRIRWFPSQYCPLLWECWSWRQVICWKRPSSLWSFRVRPRDLGTLWPESGWPPRLSPDVPCELSQSKFTWSGILQVTDNQFWNWVRVLLFCLCDTFLGFFVLTLFTFLCFPFAISNVIDHLLFWTIYCIIFIYDQ